MPGFIDYFDLNRRSVRIAARTVRPDYRILQADGVPGAPTPPPPTAQPARVPPWEQALMYLGLVVGVLFSSAVSQFKEGKTVSLTFTVWTVVLSLVIAFLIVPVAFEKLSAKLDSPLLVRIGLFVQHGVFWNVLFAALGKAFAP